MGKMLEELRDPRIREVIIYSYRMIYEIVEDNVEILTLVHSRRNFSLSDNE